MAYVEHRDDDCGDHDEGDARLMANLRQDLPALAEHHASVEDQRRPGQRTGKRQHEELLHVDMGKASRQRDERAHDRQHAAEEHGLEAVLVEPVLRHIDMRLLDEEVVAVAVDERSAAVMANEIGEDRAGHAADHACRQRAGKRQLAREDQIACKTEDEFTRHRDAGILRGHEDGNREIPPRSNELQEHRRKLFHVCKSSFLNAKQYLDLLSTIIHHNLENTRKSIMRTHPGMRSARDRPHRRTGRCPPTDSASSWPAACGAGKRLPRCRGCRRAPCRRQRPRGP